MDHYCIDRGTLLDNSAVTTLAEPGRHSIHCAVDVAVCYDSGFSLLELVSTNNYRVKYNLAASAKDVVLQVGKAERDNNGDNGEFRITVSGTLAAATYGNADFTIEHTAITWGGVACSDSAHDGGVATASPPPSAPSSCPPSSRAGYDCMVDPPGASEGYRLHWSVAALEVQYLAETSASDGWVAVGWSPDGLMVGSDAVVGWAGDAQAYQLNSKSTSGVEVDASLTITDASCAVDDGALLLRFTRQLSTGRIALDPTKAASHLWAVGGSAQLSHHSARGAFSLALGDGAVSVQVTELAIKKTVHGVLMLLGWGVLLPAGVLVARYLQWSGPLWFRLHLALQMTGLALGVAGLVLALSEFAPFGGSVGGHSTLGLVVSALGLLQPLNGILRPHKGEPRRRLWELVHKNTGRLALVLAAPTIVLGIVTLDDQEGLALPDAMAGFTGAYGAVLGLMLLGAAYMQMRGWGATSRIAPADAAAGSGSELKKLPKDSTAASTPNDS